MLIAGIAFFKTRKEKYADAVEQSPTF